MNVNKTKSGLLRILERRGKVSLVNNSLNITEVNCYKYLGVIINQSLLIENQININTNKSISTKKRNRNSQAILCRP